MSPSSPDTSLDAVGATEALPRPRNASSSLSGGASPITTTSGSAATGASAGSAPLVISGGESDPLPVRSGSGSDVDAAAVPGAGATPSTAAPSAAAVLQQYLDLNRFLDPNRDLDINSALDQPPPPCLAAAGPQQAAPAGQPGSSAAPFPTADPAPLDLSVAPLTAMSSADPAPPGAKSTDAEASRPQLAQPSIGTTTLPWIAPAVRAAIGQAASGQQAATGQQATAAPESPRSGPCCDGPPLLSAAGLRLYDGATLLPGQLPAAAAAAAAVAAPGGRALQQPVSLPDLLKHPMVINLMFQLQGERTVRAWYPPCITANLLRINQKQRAL